MNVEDESTTHAGNEAHSFLERQGAHRPAGNGEQVTSGDLRAVGVPNVDEGPQRHLPQAPGGFAISEQDAPNGNAPLPGLHGLKFLIEVITRMR